MTISAEEFIRRQLQAYLDDKGIADIPVILQRPKEEQFGDFACNMAMQLAKPLRKNPRAIADDIVAFIHQNPRYISKIEIAGPGFINFHAAKTNLLKQFAQILQEKENYGRLELGKGQRAQIEFVSANPTGPLTIGHGRQAVLGDTVANILENAGYDVTREYYFNNAGRQMRILGESVRLRYKQLCGEQVDFPEDHYQGEYIADIARGLQSRHGNDLLKSEEVEPFKQAAEDAI